ncbi:MAG: indole-3-glycerol phosphate synthase TrpC, partial [Pseudomonadota bacterium]
MGSNDTLSRILADTRERLNKAKKTTSIAQMQSELGAAPSLRGFQSRLHAQAAKGKTALICELKKASPSRGLIRADFDPAQLAQAYQQGGACCLSVLTDAPWFQGCNADLQAARAASNLPVLRKDFMIDPWQILESRLLGADCVLLIMAALARNQAI